ncbi:MAG TPA: hypothetical protein VGI93_03915 [Steroidobacteraceae bacterium]|jgi:hypothetical protein
MRFLNLPGVLGLAAVLIGTLSANASAEPHMQSFQYFVGRWSCAGHFVANGAEIKSTVTFTYDAPTATLSVRHDDLAPNKYHAVELWGAAGSAYRNTMGDAYSGIRWFRSPGFVGDRLSWTRNDGTGAPAERFTYLRQGARMGIEWWIAKPGAGLALGDTSDCRRSA